MGNKDYDQQKRECLRDFCKEHGFIETADVKGIFGYAFDRAYALGREKETITQEEIENEAVDYAFGENKKRPDARPDTAPEYMCEDLIDAFKAGANFALGKQEKEADTVIQGWVARDEDGFISIYQNNPIRDGYDCNSFWHDCDSGSHIELPITSLPDLTWESEPQEVEIIIKRKNNE